MTLPDPFVPALQHRPSQARSELFFLTDYWVGLAGPAHGEVRKARQPGGPGSGVAKLTNSRWLSLALRVVLLWWLSSAG